MHSIDCKIREEALLEALLEVSFEYIMKIKEVTFAVFLKLSGVCRSCES